MLFNIQLPHLSILGQFQQVLPEEHPRSQSLLSLAVTLRPHLCPQGPYLSLLPLLKDSGIQEELEELLLAVGPQAHPVVAMTTMPASIFLKPLFPALPLSLSCHVCACWVPLQ